MMPMIIVQTQREFETLPGLTLEAAIATAITEQFYAKREKY